MARIQKSHTRHFSSFLILLVPVFGLIVFLAFAPVFSSSLKSEHRDMAVMNLKQISLGIQLCASDHQGFLPSGPNWQSELDPYLKNEKLFELPERKGEGSYALNASLQGRKISEIGNPSRTPVIFESTKTGRSTLGGRSELRRSSPEICMAMADGSALRIKLSEAELLDWEGRPKND